MVSVGVDVRKVPIADMTRQISQGIILGDQPGSVLGRGARDRDALYTGGHDETMLRHPAASLARRRMLREGLNPDQSSIKQSGH